jgi:hypothetical protein
MSQRIINPRVIDGSRWLAKRNGAWVVLEQVATVWDREKQEMFSYMFQVEETGEKIDLPAATVWETINAKKMIDIGRHDKQDILSGKY